MQALEGCVKPFKAISGLVGQSVENTPRTIVDGCRVFPETWDLVLKILVSPALPVILRPPAKVWLLESGVGSLWLAINVITGGGIAVLF